MMNAITSNSGSSLISCFRSGNPSGVYIKNFHHLHGPISAHRKVLYHPEPHRKYLELNTRSVGEMESQGTRVDTEEGRRMYQLECAGNGMLPWDLDSDDEHDTLALHSIPCLYFPFPTFNKLLRPPAASPYFRRTVTVIELGLKAEAPWVVAHIEPYEEYKHFIRMDIREGTYVRLADQELGESTRGFDYPVIYGKVLEFRGSNDWYVLATIDILLFTQRAKHMYLSYATERPIAIDTYRRETTSL